MHPYITFCEYTLRLAYEEADHKGSVPPRVRGQWDDWVYRARQSAVFGSPELRSQLEDYVTRWLMLATRARRRS
jgi:hypothetical protein